MLLLDGVRYHLWTPQNEEKDFHPIIKEYSKEIFGEDSVYFDLRSKVSSKSGIAAIPDAYVISLSKPFSWHIVEIELASHPVYDHIVAQLTKFFNGIKNFSSRYEIRDALYDEIREDRLLRAYIDGKIGADDLHHFMSTLIQQDPQVVIIIDKATENVSEACEALANKPRILEFKTYRREDAESVSAYVFEPLSGGPSPPPPPPPPVKKTWKEMLEWANPKTKELAVLVGKRIQENFRDVIEDPSGRNNCFFKSRRGSNSVFAALLLKKASVKIRIQTDPNTFSDPSKWTGDKVYKGWFFPKGQEKEFEIDSSSQLDYAMKLIAQSYALAH